MIDFTTLQTKEASKKKAIQERIINNKQEKKGKKNLHQSNHHLVMNVEI